MAQIYGQPPKTPGERVVYEALQLLPPECIVYSEPKVTYRSEERYPDFVIVYHMWGVIVLEVKDWTDISDCDQRGAWLSGGDVYKTSPVQQARGAAQVLENMLKRDRNLQSYAGGLDFFYAYAGVLPYLPPATITWLESQWGENYLLGRSDLDPERITRKLSAINGFSVNRLMMTEEQVRAVCAIIDPKNKATDHRSGQFKGVYTREQESVWKEVHRPKEAETTEREQAVQAGLGFEPAPEPQARLRHLEEGMPEEVSALRSAAHVRLIRGFPGTGKTDVLILRAHYLHEQYPDLDILVTTFNDPLWSQRLKPELESLQPRVDVIKCDTLCSGIYHKKHGRWLEPQGTLGLVQAMTADCPLIDKLGATFLADEFIWMKEMGRTTRQDYVMQPRTGRGVVSKKTLGKKTKERIFDLFEAYEARLADLPAYDWVDLHDKTLAYLNDGVEPDRRYDVILIDEAQHFAPTWMRIIDHFLKPGGSLFLCDDPSQGVYRYFSWRQKGVNVVGRTRWLRVPFRNTRQIFQAAWSLIADNPLAQRLLAESGDQVQPDIDHSAMRDGPPPEAHYFGSVSGESEFLRDTVRSLIQEGVYPQEIGILHCRKHVLDRCRSLGLPDGVQVNEVRRQTGLEYKVVFVPRAHEMSEREVGRAWQDDEARNLQQFYVTMSRARDRVYLSYGQKWPKYLEALRPHLTWVKH